MIQHKVTTFICNKYIRSDSPIALVNRKIFSLHSRRKFHCVKFLHNIMARYMNITDLPYLHPVAARQTRNTSTHFLQPIFSKTNTFWKLFSENYSTLELTSDWVIMWQNSVVSGRTYFMLDLRLLFLADVEFDWLYKSVSLIIMQLLFLFHSQWVVFIAYFCLIFDYCTIARTKLSLSLLMCAASPAWAKWPAVFSNK